MIKRTDRLRRVRDDSDDRWDVVHVTGTQDLGYRVGDVVEFIPGTSARRAGWRFRVKKIMQVNVQLEVPGETRGLRADREIVRRCPGAEPRRPGVSAAEATPIAYHPPLVTGQFVTVAGPGWKQPLDVIYSVIRDNVENVKLVRAGGEGGRYWPKVPRAYCTPVTVTLTVVTS